MTNREHRPQAAELSPVLVSCALDHAGVEVVPKPSFGTQ
jgi:hypothetical protein